MSVLGKIHNHVPQVLRESNPNVDKLLDIFQELTEFVGSEISKYSRSFDPFTADTIEWVRKFVDDFGGQYLLNTHRESLECLYKNKNYIYSKKGTEAALNRVLNCYLAPYNCSVFSIEYTRGYPLIHFFTLDGGILPEGQDIADELNGVYDPPKYVPTILDNSWLTYYKSCVVEISCTQFLGTEFIEFLKYIVYLFSPMLEGLGVITIITGEVVLVDGGTNEVLLAFPTLQDGGTDTNLETSNIIEDGGDD